VWSYGFGDNICNLRTNISVRDGDGNDIFHQLSHFDDDHSTVELFYNLTKYFPDESLKLHSASNEYGDAPIHVACKNGKRDVVSCVIKLGCDFNMMSTVTWKTALDIAVEQHNEALISLLSQLNLLIQERLRRTATEFHSQDVGGHTFDEIRAVEVVKKALVNIYEEAAL
jgi:hypothetical protein